MATVLSISDFIENHAEMATIVLIEHLGDIVACEPVLRHVKKQHPERKIAWIVKEKYFDVVVAHPQLDYIVGVKNLTEATVLAKYVKDHSPVVNLHFSGRKCESGIIANNENDSRITCENYYHWGSLLEAFSLAAHLPALTDAPEFHLLPEVELPKLPDKYVVFHCFSNESDRNWTQKNWKRLLYFFLSNNIHVVEVGLTPCLSSSNPLFIDMTSVHSIQKIAKIIANAYFFVGVDSSFAHIANALKVNGIVIMGKYRDFSRHVPYTGYYKESHIVRSFSQPAAAVTPDMVVEKYLQLCSEEKIV